MKHVKLLISIVLIAAALCVSAMTGYYAGARSESTRKNASEAVSAANNAPSGGPDGDSAQSQGQVLSPEDLAKAKGVPAVSSHPDGDYTLVSVIEGASLNQRLSENLQLIVLQRQQLAALAKQYDEAPVAAVQQRELIAGRMNEVRNLLGANLRFMAKNYGFSLNYNYVRVPHHVSLIDTAKVDDKDTSEVVHEFQSAQDYLKFQEKNNAYLRVKMDLSKAADVKHAPEATRAAGDGATPEVRDNAEVSAMRDGLMQTYHYDPERQYSLQYQKTALYARVAK